MEIQSGQAAMWLGRSEVESGVKGINYDHSSMEITIKAKIVDESSITGKDRKRMYFERKGGLGCRLPETPTSTGKGEADNGGCVAGQK